MHICWLFYHNSLLYKCWLWIKWLLGKHQCIISYSDTLLMYFCRRQTCCCCGGGDVWFEECYDGNNGYNNGEQTHIHTPQQWLLGPIKTKLAQESLTWSLLNHLVLLLQHSELVEPYFSWFNISFLKKYVQQNIVSIIIIISQITNSTAKNYKKYNLFSYLTESDIVHNTILTLHSLQLYCRHLHQKCVFVTVKFQ